MCLCMLCVICYVLKCYMLMSYVLMCYVMMCYVCGKLERGQACMCLHMVCFMGCVICYVLCVLMCYMCGKLERGQAETGVRSICASLLLIRAVPNIFYLSKVVAILYFRLRISPENFENWFLLAASLQSRAWSAYCPYIARSHIAHCPSAQLDDQLPIGQSSRPEAWL